MKRIAVGLNMALLLAISCNSKKTDEAVTNKDTLQVATAKDTSSIKEDRHYFWTSDFDQKNGMFMKKTAPISEDLLTASAIIAKINNDYTDIKLEFGKISHDSIFIKIKKSTYLTQQMGSTGAEAYLAEVTYNLTELPGINYVDLNFKEGDHATPGTYSRIDFIQVKE